MFIDVSAMFMSFCNINRIWFFYCFAIQSPDGMYNLNLCHFDLCYINRCGARDFKNCVFKQMWIEMLGTDYRLKYFVGWNYVNLCSGQPRWHNAQAHFHINDVFNCKYPSQIIGLGVNCVLSFRFDSAFFTHFGIGAIEKSVVNNVPIVL